MLDLIYHNIYIQIIIIYTNCNCSISMVMVVKVIPTFTYNIGNLSVVFHSRHVLNSSTTALSFHYNNQRYRIILIFISSASPKYQHAVSY